MKQFFDSHSKRDVFLWLTGFVEASIWCGGVVAAVYRHDWVGVTVAAVCLPLTIWIHARYIRENPASEGWLDSP